MLVTEFQPFPGDNLIVIAVGGLLLWRHIRGDWDRRCVDNPVFILAVLGWTLGFISYRFWLDWGMPATYAWMILEFQALTEKRIDIASWQRLFLTMAVVLVCYFGITSDVNSRWTRNLTKEYLSAKDTYQAPWLPGDGGIVYSDDMSVFYDMFFKNPHAPWRYILGFEPTMMPSEDLAIYRRIQWNYGEVRAFEPWVKKMRPEDRLIIKNPINSLPQIPDLEWNYAATGIWIGRLPQQND
jgi:hypothetical protein